MNRTFGYVVGGTLVALLFSYTLTFAASTATVAATVTVQNISMTLSTSGTIAWGILPVNTASSTNPAYTQSFTNSGNVPENFLVQGQNSASWTLATTNGIDTYVESFCATSCTTAPTGYTALTTSNQTLASNIAVSGTSPLDLYIKVPTSSSVFTSQSVDVTVTAVAF